MAVTVLDTEEVPEMKLINCSIPRSWVKCWLREKTIYFSVNFEDVSAKPRRGQLEYSDGGVGRLGMGLPHAAIVASVVMIRHAGSDVLKVKTTYVRYLPSFRTTDKVRNNLGSFTIIPTTTKICSMGFARSLSPSAWDLAESVSDISIADDTPNSSSDDSGNTDDIPNTDDITNTKELATHVRICPHHTLSFQQLQQLASTRLIEEERSLGILKKLYPPHRYKVKDNTKHQSCSQIYFRNSARLQPGFELCASWEAVSSRLRYSDYSKDDMRHMLEGSNVWLCPHIKLCNDWVIDAMFFLLKQNDGGHTAKGVKGIRKDCGCCPTAVQVRCLTERPMQELEARLQVNTKRQLGHGLCEDDHDWQDQCPSMTDDERSGSEIDGRREFRCGVQYIRGMIDPEMPSGAQRKLEGEVIRCIRRLGLD